MFTFKGQAVQGGCSILGISVDLGRRWSCRQNGGWLCWMRKGKVMAKDGSPLLMEMVNLHRPRNHSIAAGIFSLLLSILGPPEKMFY